jgi:hypothetical protein
MTRTVPLVTGSARAGLVVERVGERDHPELTWPRLLAMSAILFWFVLSVTYFLGRDALTYLAAGERLNAGHPLYELSPGDRQIPLVPPYWTVPILSPPLIAVIWRPLAVLPGLGLAVWLAVHGIAMLWAVWTVVGDWRSAALVAVLAVGLGLELVAGNMLGFFLAAYVVVWRYRDRPWIGALIGVLAVAKFMPIALLGFLVARRDRRHLAAFAFGVVAAGFVGLVGAGWDAHVAYLDVLRSSAPQPMSLAWMTGQTWLSPAILAGGVVVASMLPERWSFRVAVLASVIGAPNLAWASFVPLVSLAAPSSKAEHSAYTA